MKTHDPFPHRASHLVTKGKKAGVMIELEGDSQYRPSVDALHADQQVRVPTMTFMYASIAALLINEKKF